MKHEEHTLLRSAADYRKDIDKMLKKAAQIKERNGWDYLTVEQCAFVSFRSCWTNAKACLRLVTEFPEKENT